MVLDGDGAHVLSRAWCLWEAWQSGLRGRGLTVLSYGVPFDRLEMVGGCTAASRGEEKSLGEEGPPPYGARMYGSAIEVPLSAASKHRTAVQDHSTLRLR
jgi:hypothetical protein